MLLGPLLIRGIASASVRLTSDEVGPSTLRSEVPRRSFSLVMLFPGLLMLLFGIVITLSEPCRILVLKLAPFSLVLAGM